MNVATLRPLPLPQPREDPADDGEEDTVTLTLGWDHSVLVDAPDEERDPGNANGEEGDHASLLLPLARRARSATFRAVAHGNLVVGTSPAPLHDSCSSNNDDEGENSSDASALDSNANGNDTNDTILWQTPLDAPVVAVAGNPAGTVIAAATAAHVSLLKGRDGRVLAARQITGEAESNASGRRGRGAPRLLFLSNTATNNAENGEGEATSSAGDILAVVCPVGPGTNRNQPNVILIADIHGQMLNSPDLTQVQEGMKSMEFLPLQSDGRGPIAWMEGSYVNPTTVRMFWGHHDGTVAVCDYDAAEKTSSVVLDDLGGHLGYDDSTAVMGAGVDAHNPESKFLLLATATSGPDRPAAASSILWIDVLDLNVVARYPLSVGASLLSCAPVRSQSMEGQGGCVAAALAISSPSGNEIVVVQATVGGDGEEASKDGAMVLFKISTGTAGDNVQVCAPSPGDGRGAYAFRCLTASIAGDASADHACWEFAPHALARVGTLHALLAHHEYEAAHGLADDLAQLTPDGDGSRIATPMDKTLVALWHFRHVLSGDLSSEAAQAAARECLRRLTTGVVKSSGGAREVNAAAAAAEHLLGWPRNQANGHAKAQSLREVSGALAAMSAAIKSATDVVRSAELGEQKRRLDERIAALAALQGLCPSLDARPIPCDDRYLAAASTVELLHLLAAEGAFHAAEALRTSSYGKAAQLSRPDVLAAAALRIPLTVDPRAVAPWLCDVVVPSLRLGHPHLGKIRAWACGAADRYDGEDLFGGLESSIELLRAVAAATARLTVATEPEPDGEEGPTEAATPRNGDASASFGSAATARSAVPRRPTVLSVGLMSGGAQRSVMSARRRATPTGSNASSLDVSFFSAAASPYSTEASFDEEEEEEEDEDPDCVECKLREALRLKRARELGLERERLALAEYASKGEGYIVKELVRAALVTAAATESHLDHSPGVVGEIRTYAASVEADFDEAVRQYANELCEDKGDDVPAVLQQAEALSRWCRAPAKKCSIVLRMLRRALVSARCPPDLTALAEEAIDMAVEEETRSELKEAARLLAIDQLVRKYCGNGAKDIFSATEPSHCRKLVQHVCRHIDAPTVLADALMLCDAFTHVSRLDTCVSLLQRVVVASLAKTAAAGEPSRRADQCASFLTEIYARDADVAERAGERAAAYCAGMLEDCKKAILRGTFPGEEEARRRAALACPAACAILSVMQDLGESGSVAPKLLREFQKISKLQEGCGVYLTLEELRDPTSRAEVVTGLLEPCVDLLLSRRSSLDAEDDSLRNELKPKVALARQWCAIVCDSPSEVSSLWASAIGTAASRVAKTATNHASLLLLEVSGLLDGRDGHPAFHSIKAVALELCERAASEARGVSRLTPNDRDALDSLLPMRSMAQASLLLRDHILVHSPSNTLPSSLSLANLTELVCDMSTRSDMGIGERVERYFATLQASSRRHSHQSNPEKSARMLADKRMPAAPNLHPEWYVGDGLLLEPNDALLLGMSYCKMMLSYESSSSQPLPPKPLMDKSEMIQVLESKGAHATLHRVLVLATATSLSESSFGGPASSSPDLMFRDAESLLKKNQCVLAERSLGGTESGITSGNVDAPMSVSFLLHLPKEMAFKIYQAALPSAVGNRDFPRILTLASIGMHCGVGKFSTGESFPWSKQKRFIDQCSDLSLNAVWWRILSQYGVSFDPSIFTQSKESKSSEQAMQTYCEELVWKAAPTKLGPRSTLKLARRFTKDYGLNKQVPPSSLIEFLLSPPHCDEADSSQPRPCHKKTDIRRDLKQTDAVVRECLALLPTLNRNIVLRKCVMSLEADPRCAKDYDRHALALQLYRECLDALSSVMKKSDARAKAHQQETDRIDRRTEALVVISSIFDQHPLDKRPEYPKLFEPLPRDPSRPGQDKTKFSVLGSEATERVADPLAPLDGILEDENGSSSIVSALSPLCILLQLPSGYLHARSLVIRLRKLKASGTSLPPFDSTVLPVAKKLRASRDKADLAWWCSLQYDAGSVEQLRCLDMAHANATVASEQAESSRDEEEERIALERVKRIDAARAGLSDKILVEEVLQRHASTTSIVKVLYKSIIDRVQQRVQSEENYCPEHLVRALLIEGSLTAASASLDETDGFSTHHFRLLALLVHDACKALSNRYSHVNVGKCARLMTRRWLVHGDELENDLDSPRESSPEKLGKSDTDESAARAEDEDTSEFVMDIGMISAGDQKWSNDASGNGQGIHSSGEPSALTPNSSRESSDHLCSRVALRIAFLICFAEGYHRLAESPEKGSENVDDNASTKKSQRRLKGKASQLSRLKSNCFEGDLALQHAQELLGIVFARQGSTIASAYGSLFDESSIFDVSMLSMVPEEAPKEEFHTKSKALSFAMRHRALRVATILCPQEVILRVAMEESYASDVGDDHLNKCAFGSFVAMEIEAMKLALPHSDLIQLSKMHFPSYARTIWRNHGGNSAHGFNGRLHLLLLELCTKDRRAVEWELLMLIFGELTRLELPRSLLLACECASRSKVIALAASQKELDVLQSVEEATRKVAELIVNEVETSVGAGIELSASECQSTLHRLVSVIIDENIHVDPTCFVQSFCDVSRLCQEQGQQAIGDVFTKAAVRIANHINDPEIFGAAKSILGGWETRNGGWRQQRSQVSVCGEAVGRFESSFYSQQ
ncbi:hypothetical protein ACHAXT_005820 [Thalassiosira profunda]